ncbi:hypothetical protein [Lentzea jiangxiensis]|uniref:Tetratricopeptide repeat-containing protein n=1 Tax=Lentzea jiangxiensis TaxID=641025 RepID=A0A1H0UH21_9PSEU|nr:hypothetical protein [Lentzea jiangxiensis]SDP65479.1 hypothetical protein SAMN05421507_1127 [Lentzea jiangxiensis]
MFAGIADDIDHARTVLHVARALTLNGQAAETVSELAAIEQAVHDYGSVGYPADLCSVLGEVHAALGDTAEADRRYGEAIDYYTAAVIDRRADQPTARTTKRSERHDTTHHEQGKADHRGGPSHDGH